MKTCPIYLLKTTWSSKKKKPIFPFQFVMINKQLYFLVPTKLGNQRAYIYTLPIAANNLKSNSWTPIYTWCQLGWCGNGTRNRSRHLYGKYQLTYMTTTYLNQNNNTYNSNTTRKQSIKINSWDKKKFKS